MGALTGVQQQLAEQLPLQETAWPQEGAQGMGIACYRSLCRMYGERYGQPFRRGVARQAWACQTGRLGAFMSHGRAPSTWFAGVPRLHEGGLLDYDVQPGMWARLASEQQLVWPKSTCGGLGKAFTGCPGRMLMPALCWCKPGPSVCGRPFASVVMRCLDSILQQDVIAAAGQTLCAKSLRRNPVQQQKLLPRLGQESQEADSYQTSRGDWDHSLAHRVSRSEHLHAAAGAGGTNPSSMGPSGARGPSGAGPA